MGRVSMATKAELVAAIGDRHRASRRTERTKILDEFVAVTGYHRKHAIRLLWPKGAIAPRFSDGSIGGTEQRCNRR